MFSADRNGVDKARVSCGFANVRGWFRIVTSYSRRRHKMYTLLLVDDEEDVIEVIERKVS